MCSRGQPSGERRRRRLIPAGQMAGRLNQQHVFPLGEGALGREADGLKPEAVVGIKSGYRSRDSPSTTPPGRTPLHKEGVGAVGVLRGDGRLWMTLWKSVGASFFLTHAAVREPLDHK